MPVVSIDTIPETLESFINLRNTLCDTPEGAAAVIILALLLYAQDDDLGRQCLAAAVHHDQLWEGPEGYQGLQISRGNMQLIRAQIADRPYMLQSYIKGTSPENGYRLPDPPYVFEFTTNKYSGNPEQGWYKLFVVCSGAASPRPVMVKKDRDGLWKAAEWSSLLVGVVPPQA